MDRIKNEKILHAAYNDKEGVTAAFNRNIIHAVNEILESRIREEDFKHLAYYCPEASRIEMYLEALSEVQIQSPFLEEEIRIGKGERIHTESSHKFDQSHLSDLADYSGLQIRAQYTDEREWFALVEFEKP